MGNRGSITAPSAGSQERVRPTASRAGLTGAVGVLLVVGLASAASLDRSCHHAGPPIATPVPGTARADACSAIGAGAPWLLLALAPLLVGVVCFGVRRSGRWVLGVTVVLSLAAIATAAIVASLNHAMTI
jgi:hypothetical protein